MSDLNLPGAEDEGIMGDEPVGEEAREQAEAAADDVGGGEGAAGVDRTPLPPD